MRSGLLLDGFFFLLIVVYLFSAVFEEPIVLDEPRFLGTIEEVRPHFLPNTYTLTTERTSLRVSVESFVPVVGDSLFQTEVREVQGPVVEVRR